MDTDDDDSDDDDDDNDDEGDDDEEDEEDSTFAPSQGEVGIINDPTKPPRSPAPASPRTIAGEKGT